MLSLSETQFAAPLVSLSASGIPIRPTQHPRQHLPRIRFPNLGHLFGGALRDDPPAAFGAQVDDPVGLFDNVEVALDDEDGIPQIGEAIQNRNIFRSWLPLRNHPSSNVRTYAIM